MDAAISAHGHAGEHDIDNDRKLKIGMGFYVLVDIIFVIFLFVAYIWLRGYNTGGGWFPDKTKLPDAGTANLLTGLIIVSAVCYYVGYLGIKRGNQTVLRVGMVLALVLEIATLVGQIRYMGHLPFVTTDGSFASTFIMLSGYHVYHLLMGLFLGVGITHRALRGRYAADKLVGVVTIGYFWYWMAAMPVLMTLLMLALPPKI
jgi:cytochrome c oxidase subunit III